MKFQLSSLLSAAVFTLGNTIFSLAPALAQVTTDGTTSTTVTNTDAGVQIDNGNLNGDNLFHSFDEFSVPTNTEAYFNNANDVVNIFSRVTGGNISNIDGILRANGAANLFLINPAGILFGENARLQLGGSFYGSTADSIIFPEGNFSATDLDNPPLITVNAPIGLGFRDNPEEIVNQSTADNLGLQVSSGNTLALVGGNVRFTDGFAIAPGADIELGGLTEAGIVTINEDGSLSFSDELAKANVVLDTLDNISIVEVIGDGGGSITVNASNFELLGGSRLLAGILEGTESPEAQAGDIVINATEKVTIDSQDTGFNTSIQNVAGNVSQDFAIDVFTKGNPGNIVINTEIFEGKGNFAISSINNGEGTVGNIDITATERASFIGEESFNSGLSSIVGFFGIGDEGNITISTPSLIISDVNISTSTFGAKNSGEIVFNVTESLNIGDRSQLQTDSFSGGDAGNIIINADNGNISIAGEDTFLTTSVASIESLAAEFPEFIELLAIFGVSPVLGSQGGDIIINARNLTVDNGVNIRALTLGEASSERLANAGNIEINVVENAVFTNNVFLATATSGQGNAGNISINAGSNVSFENDSDLSSSVFDDETSSTEEFEQLRQGGDITISANSLSLTDSSTINASTFGLGNAGNIELNINENLNLSNSSRLDSDTTGGGNAGNVKIDAGNAIALDETSSINTRVLEPSDDSAADFASLVEGGDITISANSLSLNEGSTISASTLGLGNAGDIAIDLNENLNLSNFSSLNSDTTGGGNAGDIELNINENLNLTNVSNISSNTNGQGDAGNININAGNTIALETSLITTAIQSRSSNLAEDSNQSVSGGDITISANSLSLTGGSIINSSTLGLGDAGNISIVTQNKIALDGTSSNDNQFSSIGSSVGLDAIGNGGKISITTNDLSLTNGAIVSAGTLGKGNGGEITIATSNLSLVGNAAITGITLGEGNGGNISITASENILLESTKSEDDSFASIISGVAAIDAVGNGGEITITTDNLSLIGNAVIDSSTIGQGDGGNISITASENILLNNTESKDGSFAGIGSSVATADALGNGGEISITTKNLSLTGSTFISGSTSGQGDGGNISVTAGENIFLNNTESENGSVAGISSSVNFDAIGNGGDIIVDAKNVSLINGSQISVSTSGDGNAGSLSINASESIGISGTQAESRSGLFANALIDDGKGGDIFVLTNKLSLLDGATITASNFSSRGFLEAGTGEAGNVTIIADSFTLSNEARIDTATRSGNGGNITFEIADTLTLRENSFISARALNNAGGGNITIDTDFIIAFPSRFDGNDIRADAEQGKGGRIDITAESVLGIAERSLNPLTNDLNASSQVAGLAGNISINTPDINPLRAKAELPNNLVTNNIVATNACSVSSTAETSNLIIKGKGGVSPEIINPLMAEDLIVDIDRSTVSFDSIHNNQIQDNQLDIANASEIKPAIETEETGKLYAAKGIIEREDGTVYLTAYPTSDKTRTLGDMPFDCGYNGAK